MPRWSPLPHSRLLLLLSLAPLATALLPAPAAAEPPTATIQLDPLTTALGFVHLQTEVAVAERVSVYAGPHLRLFDNLVFGEPENIVGYGVEVGVRYFLTGTAPEGAWALVRGVGAWIEAPDADTSGVGGYVSALGGYTWIGGGWLVLSGGLGVQYLHYHVAGLGPKGVLPAAHTAIGVAF